MVNTNLEAALLFFSSARKILVHTFDLIGIPEPTNKAQLKFRRMLYENLSKEFSNQKKKGYKENHKDNINVGMGGCNWIITNIIMSRMSLIIWDEPSKKIHVKNFKISGWYMDDTWANMRHKGFGNHKTTSQTIITKHLKKMLSYFLTLSCKINTYCDRGKHLLSSMIELVFHKFAWAIFSYE